MNRYPYAPRHALCSSLLFVLLIGVLLALAVPAGGAAAQPAAPQVTLTGTLSVLVGDPQDPAQPPRERYFITDDSGVTIELFPELGSAVLSMPALAGRRVTVSGLLDAASDTLRVTAVAALALEAEPDASAATADETQTWLSLGCKFADVADEQRDQAYFQGMYGDGYPLLPDYWQSVTYGQMTISGDAAGWFTLPKPRSAYFLPNGSADLYLLFEDCTAAADPFVYFPESAHVQLMFNAPLDCCAWGGVFSNAYVLDGHPISRATLLPPWAFTNLSAVAHEMGHANGLYHTRHSNPALGVYSNIWDVMSDTWTNCALNTDPTYGCIPQGMASLHKGGYRDWIPESQVYTAQPGAQMIVLENATHPRAGGYLAAVVPVTTQTNYWIEVRSREGYDTRLPGEGVIIHLESFSPYQSQLDGYLVDRDPWGNGLTDSAVWSPGEVFTGQWSYVRVLERTATGGYRLEIVHNAEKEVTSLLPAGDTYVDSTRPSRAFGGSTTLHTLEAASSRRAYFKFDTSGLPDSIVEARLSLTPTSAEAGAAFGRAFAVPCDYAGTVTPWTESGLNWKNAPAPVGHYLDQIDNQATAGQPSSFVVTPAMLGADETCFAVEGMTGNLIKFSSKEGPNPPKLWVTYLLQPGPPPETTTTFAPTNDATASQAKPTAIYGAKPTLQVKDAAKDLNAYVKFNVSDLSGTVQSATLRLWVNNPGPDGGAVYAVSPFYLDTSTQWLETGLKWNNAPALSGAPLDTAGTAVKGQWVELDVTSAVVAALSADGRVSLALANDSRNLVTYSSKEGAHPPELILITN